MEKTWFWTVTGYTFVGRKTHEEIQSICQLAGLAGIEGAPELFDGHSDSKLETLRTHYQAARVKIETFHLPFNAEDDIASFYETARRQAVARIRRWMERSSRIGARIGIQHPSTSRYSVTVEGFDCYLRQLGKSLDTLLRTAEELDYTIALENMLPGADGPRLGSRPEHFQRFIEAFAHPNLGFCLDTGHALVAGGPEGADDFYAVMGPHIAAYHLADNAGDRDSHLAPGHGLVDWTTVFRRTAERGYSGSMCIETPPFAAGPNYSIEAWRCLVAEADGLVKKAFASP